MLIQSERASQQRNCSHLPSCILLIDLSAKRSYQILRFLKSSGLIDAFYLLKKPVQNIRDMHQVRKPDAVGWVSSFVAWYNHQHRHSGIKFVTPHQRHCGEAIEVCRQRSRVYELARIANPKRWSRSIRCWKQPDLVWINPPADDFIAHTAKLEFAA